MGGGTSGATAARYLKMADPSVEVTLIEANKDYYTCYLSNEVLGGARTLDSLKHGYSGLEKEGITVVHDYVTGIDAKAKKVTVKGGSSFDYDRCIVAPGISFKYDGIEGYDESMIDKVPQKRQKYSHCIESRQYDHRIINDRIFKGAGPFLYG